MIIEYERNTNDDNDIEYEQIDETPYEQISHEHTPWISRIHWNTCKH
jgi:hypothetical protein